MESIQELVGITDHSALDKLRIDSTTCQWPIFANIAFSGRNNTVAGEREAWNMFIPARFEAGIKQALILDEIRPDPAKCDVLFKAIGEMQICKEIFADWNTQLSCAVPARNDKLELSIITTVRQLDVDASAALQSSYSILQSYESLMRLVNQELSKISASRTGGFLFSSTETSGLASAISTHSNALTIHVRSIQERLRELVRDIELTKKSTSRRTLKKKIWIWLSRAFKALSVMISVGGAIFALVHPLGDVESGAITGASMLSVAAARLCDITHDKYNETTFDKILSFLRDNIPESAKTAEVALTSFLACHNILQMELEVRRGTRSGWVSPSDADRARPHWDQAEKRLRVVHFQCGNII